MKNAKVMKRGNTLARWTRRLSLLLLVVAGATGCEFDQLLDVEAPSEVPADELSKPQYAELLVRSVITDFECAFGGYILATGIFGDVFADAQLTFGYYWPVDRRQIDAESSPLTTPTCASNAAPGVYTALQVARFQADDVAAQLEGWTDEEVEDRRSKIAVTYAYGGYATLLLAESYCSIAIDVGPELTRDEAFDAAEARFTKAIGAAESAGNDVIRNMALVGRARTRLNLAIEDGSIVDMQQLTAAVADAEQVPQGFVKGATFDEAPTRRRNNIFNANNFSEYFTIEADFRNLEFQGVSDPRVPVTNTGRTGADNLTPLYVQDKYSSFGSTIPIATWDEAQLIVAEAAARTGNAQQAVNIIDALHDSAGLPSYAGGSDQEVLQHVIEERSRELFLEGQHLGDKLRYGLAFTPAPGTPYPPKAGGVYGDTRCLPLPLQEERNNPNI